MRPPDSPSGQAGTEQPPADAQAAELPDSGAAETERSQSAGSAPGKSKPVRAKRARTGKILDPATRVMAPVGRAFRRLRPSAPTGSLAQVRAAEIAGGTLARLTALPVLLIIAWLLPALPLLLAGSFEPLPMLLISVPLAVALIVNGLRSVPVGYPRVFPGRSRDRTWTYWFGLLATVGVVAGLTAWQLIESSQSVIVTRDPGTYLQTGYWVAGHGSLPIPDMLAGFGGAHAGLNFASIGFLAHGTSVVPAVMPGLPLLQAIGFWAHGVTAATAVGPVLGGLATLSFAGLVARLVGPQWAPVGALVLGLTLPQQYISRTSLSETALQIVLFGGLCLLVDSLVLQGWPERTKSAGEAGSVTDAAAATDAAIAAANSRSRIPGFWLRPARPGRWFAWLTPPQVTALLAGLALGLGLLISLDALLYVLPIIPFGGVLVAGRRPQAATFLTGVAVGCAYGLVAGALIERPLVDSVGDTAALAGVVAVWLIVASIIGIVLAGLGWVRKIVPRALARRPLRWLPDLGGLVVLAALIGFAVRPYVQTVRGHPTGAQYLFIESLQRMQHLKIDPARLYSEQTLYWVIWYIGLPTVLLGGFGLSAQVRRSLRALLTWRDPARVWRTWALPLAMICAGSVTVLWSPDIVPDQPWASRRLVVMVLPGLIICGLWAASWLTARARDRGARQATAAVAGLFCAAAMLVPTIATTFGLGFSHSGQGNGLKPVVQGMATHRTGAGEIAAVRALCAQIPGSASVVILSGSTAATFTQTIRGMCGVPVASMVGQPTSAVASVVGSISAAGRRPILLASRPHMLAGFGGSPQKVMDLVTAGDPHELTQVPTGPTPLHYVIWMTAPSSPGVGT